MNDWSDQTDPERQVADLFSEFKRIAWPADWKATATDGADRGEEDRDRPGAVRPLVPAQITINDRLEIADGEIAHDPTDTAQRFGTADSVDPKRRLGLLKLVAALLVLVALPAYLLFPLFGEGDPVAQPIDATPATTQFPNAPDRGNNVEIIGLRVTAIASDSAIVTFSTNDCSGARYEVDNGAGIHQDGFPNEDECWSEHAATLGRAPYTNDPLRPATDYSVIVTTFALDGTEATETITFTTLSDVAIRGLTVLTPSATSGSVAFTTADCATVTYTLNNGAGQFSTDECVNSHQPRFGVTPFGEALSPNTSYVVQIETVGADGATGADEATFTTLE